MITCPDLDAASVASHYDDLDRFYRDVWGEHLHHGLWLDGKEDTATAVRQLVDAVATRACAAGARVCDVGCGYGGTARILTEEYGATVTALTISREQFEHARAQNGAAANPEFLLRDWLANDLPAGSFDSVIAVESLAHMVDKAAFFREAHRVLRPGGRLVVCAWLVAERPRRWQVHRLLLPICREGRLAGMGSACEYRELLAGAGFIEEEFHDWSRQVRRTWSVCAVRLLRRLLTRADYRRFLLDSRQTNRMFARSLFRIWLAYRCGVMRYGLLIGRKG